MTERSKARVYGRSLAGIAGSNPAGGIDGSPLLVLCVLSGLCDGLITRLEESYRLWCVHVCDLGTSRMRRLKLIEGCKSRLEEEEEELNSSTANQMCINENYSQAQKTNICLRVNK